LPAAILSIARYRATHLESPLESQLTDYQLRQLRQLCQPHPRHPPLRQLRHHASWIFESPLLLHVGVRILSLGAHFLDALLESSCGIVVRDVGVSGERTKYSRREHNSTGACSDDRSKPFLKPVPDGWFVGFHRFLSSRITHSRLYKLSSKSQ